jgi:hypothetical protein
MVCDDLIPGKCPGTLVATNKSSVNQRQGHLASNTVNFRFFLVIIIDITIATPSRQISASYFGDFVAMFLEAGSKILFCEGTISIGIPRAEYALNLGTRSSGHISCGGDQEGGKKNREFSPAPEPFRKTKPFGAVFPVAD